MGIREQEAAFAPFMNDYWWRRFFPKWLTIKKIAATKDLSQNILLQRICWSIISCCRKFFFWNAKGLRGVIDRWGKCGSFVTQRVYRDSRGRATTSAISRIGGRGAFNDHVQLFRVPGEKYV